MDAVHQKGAWNRVVLTLPFKNANNNIVHVVATVCEKQYAEEYKYLVQNVMKFHELRSALNSESTTCFTDGHKGSDAALQTVCPFDHVSYLIYIRVLSGHLQVDACKNMKK